MWHLGTGFSGGLDSVRSVVGLDGLRGLFEPKRFNDSMVLIFVWCRDIAIFTFFNETMAMLEVNSLNVTAASVCRMLLANVISIPFERN